MKKNIEGLEILFEEILRRSRKDFCRLLEKIPIDMLDCMFLIDYLYLDNPDACLGVRRLLNRLLNKIPPDGFNVLGLLDRLCSDDPDVCNGILRLLEKIPIDKLNILDIISRLKEKNVDVHDGAVGLLDRIPNEQLERHQTILTNLLKSENRSTRIEIQRLLDKIAPASSEDIERDEIFLKEYFS